MNEEVTRILVVDDEPAVRKVVTRALEDAGYDVWPVPDRRNAMAALSKERFHLAILDVQLPDANGLDLCGELVRDHRLPVVMLTVVADEADAVRALESGAEDYVRKPFGVRELIARVASALRRAQSVDGTQAAIEAGALRLDPRSYRAQVGDAALPLTPTEFRLSALLAQNAGRVLTHDELLRQVWGREYAGEHHMLHVTISRLRQKLARLGDGASIRTIPGVGYELTTAGA
jgi:two-component system KDP operon response regulator KdpE